MSLVTSDGTAPEGTAPEGTARQGTLARDTPPPLATRSMDAPTVYVATHEGRVAVADTARAALTAVGRAAEVDPDGVAGVLWRGGPVDARLPLRGVVGIPAGGRAQWIESRLSIEGPPLPTARVSLDVVRERLSACVGGRTFSVLTRGAHGSLALLALRRLAGGGETDAFTIHWPGAPEGDVHEAGRCARVLGARHHVLRPDAADPASALGAWLACCDLPSLEGFRSHLVEGALARAGLSRVATPVGAAALFGLGDAFAAVARVGIRAALRSRPPRELPDVFDLSGQRALERNVWRRVPVHAAHSMMSILPAATRAALHFARARPPDGLPPMHAARSVVVAEAVLRALSDLELRAPSPRAWRPFLVDEVSHAARALAPRTRFGRVGSGGPLRGWLRRAHGWVASSPAEGFHVTLDRWLRGPLASFLSTWTTPAGIAANGVLRADGVARLLALWRAGGDPMLSRAVFLVAVLEAWVDRVRTGGRS